MLFDLGSTYFYVLIDSASKFSIICDIIDAFFHFLPKLESQSQLPMSIVPFLFIGF